MRETVEREKRENKRSFEIKGGQTVSWECDLQLEDTGWVCGLRTGGCMLRVRLLTEGRKRKLNIRSSHGRLRTESTAFDWRGHVLGTQFF